MPVKLKIAPHDADAVSERVLPRAVDSQAIVESVWCMKMNRQCKEILQSSIERETIAEAHLAPSVNGFIYSVIHAYNHHHHLVIRPDDVWIAIISQLNIYINAHAEGLRHKFVKHEGKKTLTVEAVGSRYSVDFDKMANQMTHLLHENILDKDLHSFIMPSFSTTTQNDIIIASVMMMSSLKEYFKYRMVLKCGIPSLTLLGTRDDYVDILARLDKLHTLGDEPSAWAHLLRPIIESFVRAFDLALDASGRPSGTAAAEALATREIDEFWSRICAYKSNASGSDYLGGWICTFCVWNRQGKWLGPPLADIVPAAPYDEDASNSNLQPVNDAMSGKSIRYQMIRASLVYRGVTYGPLTADKISPGWCEVDVKLDDNGKHLDCIMVAGHVTIEASSSHHATNSSAEAASDGDKILDTLQPSPQWFMFVR